MCFACIYVCVQCVCLLPAEIKRGHGSSGTGIPNGWNHVVGAGIEPSPLDEQSVLLSIEPSLQPLGKIFHTPFITVL